MSVVTVTANATAEMALFMQEHSTLFGIIIIIACLVSLWFVVRFWQVTPR